jgi:hypothetical protein
MNRVAKLAGVAGLMTAMSAQAGFIVDTANVGPIAGTASSIPANNDLASILSAHGLNASSYYIGGRLFSDVQGTVSYQYLGKEAGFINQFDIYSGTSVLFSTAGHPNSSWNPSALSAPLAVSAGQYLDFTFCTSGGGGQPAGCISNANNSYFSQGNLSADKTIALTLLDPFTALLWWDDSGAGPDSDHDDMVVLAKLSVPEPGTSALFGLGLLGMGLAVRKKAQPQMLSV